MIYICSPYKGDVEHNIEQVRQICHKVSEKGKIPFAPHLYFTQFLNDNDPVERTQGISFGIAMMLFCEEVWVFGNIISEGMRLEIEYANDQGKAVKYFGTRHDL